MSRRGLRVACALALLCLVAVRGVRATVATGSVCVNRFGEGPQPCAPDTVFPNGQTLSHFIDGFHPESSRFHVQFDDLDPVEISCSQSATVTGLALGKKHLVRISMDSRQLQSFRFTFEARGGPRLCLDFGTGYGTWNLQAEPSGSTKPCRCVPSIDLP